METRLGAEKNFPTLLEQLKSFGTCDWNRIWPDYSKVPFDSDIANQLIQIVKDDFDTPFDGAEEDADELLPWLPVHAWRILAYNKYQESLPTLIDRLMLDTDDDYAFEDIPDALAYFGPMAVETVIKYLSDGPVSQKWVHGDAALLSVLTKIATSHPEEQIKVTLFFRQLLSQYKVQPPSFNSFIVSEIIDLKDASSSDLVEKVFSEKFIDLEIIDWKWATSKLPSLPQSLLYKKPDTSMRYDGDDSFRTLLCSLDIPFSLEDAKFLILGAILAVDFVQPSVILDDLLYDWDEHPVKFTSEGQAVYVHNQFLGLWNQLADFQDRLFPGPTSHFDNFDLSHDIVRMIVHTRLSLFLTGLTKGMRPQYDSFITNNNAFTKYLINAEKILSSDHASPLEKKEHKTLLEDLSRFWDEHFLIFASDCKRFRAEKLKRLQLSRQAPLGRNDPCHCGSGKKYKKCCLTLH